jgi:hypothetical protein
MNWTRYVAVGWTRAYEVNYPKIDWTWIAQKARIEAQLKVNMNGPPTTTTTKDSNRI